MKTHATPSASLGTHVIALETADMCVMQLFRSPATTYRPRYWFKSSD
jgi:hypothetical protein